MKPSCSVSITALLFLLCTVLCNLVPVIGAEANTQLVLPIEQESYAQKGLRDNLLQRSIIGYYHDSIAFDQTLAISRLLAEHLSLLEASQADSVTFFRSGLYVASAYSYLGLYEQSLFYIEKCLEYEDNGSSNDQLYARQLAAVLAEKTGDSDKALTNYKTSYQLAGKQGELRVMRASLIDIVRLCIDTKDLNKALLFIKAAEPEIQTGNESEKACLMIQQARLNLQRENGSTPHNQAMLLADSLLNKPVTEINAAVVSGLAHLVTELHATTANRMAGLVQCNELSKQLKLTGLQVRTGFDLFNAFADSDQERAMAFFEETVSLLKTTNAESIASINSVISQLTAFRQGEFKRAGEKGIEGGNNQIWPITSWLLALLACLASFVFLSFKIAKQKKALLENEQNMLAEISSLEGQIKITDKEIDTRINERNQALMEELKEREKVDQELKSALARAEDANYLKNAFLSNMSHEIRTPLNGIMGFANLLELELALIEQPELFEYANSIQKSGERLLHLLNNIIDISRIEANDLMLQIKSFELKALLDQVISLFNFRANEKGIRIASDISNEVYVEVDPETLTRVLSEILDNAIKYTDKGYVKIELVENDPEGMLSLMIKDTGIGIDSSYLPFIFEAFRQESLGYTRQYQGAGLGLPLAKRMMNLMGGQLEVYSEKSIGTNVRLIIPYASIAAIPEQAAPEVAESPKTDDENPPLNILVVEDDHSSKIILSKYLGEYGKVSAVSDGDLALMLIEKYYHDGFIFDVLFLDINLPAPWDGIRLREEIQQRWPVYKEIPFVAETAYAMSGDEERFLQIGFTAYMAKPVQGVVIARTIAEIMPRIKLNRMKTSD